MPESDTTPTDPAAELRPRLAIGALIALSIAAFWEMGSYESYRKVAERLEGADELFFSPTGASPTFVLGISAYLLYHRRAMFAAALGAPMRSWLAGPLLALSMASFGWAHYTGANHLVACSLAVFLLGSAELLGGRLALRAVLPSALLAFMLVPAPPMLFNTVMYELQVAIAGASVQIVSLLGVESFQAGEQIVTRERIFQVIESCAGLRITETLIATAPLYAALWYRTDRRMALLTACSLLLGVVVNQLRVVSLVLSPYSQFQTVHLAQGLAMIVVGVLLIAATDALLERGGIYVRTRGDLAGVPPRPVRFPTVPALVCAAVSASLIIMSFVVPHWQPPRDTEPSVQRLRTLLKRIPSAGEKIDQEYLGSVDYSDRVYRNYEHGGASISLFVGTDDRTNLGRSLFSSKSAIGRPGWEVERAWNLFEADAVLGSAYVMHSKVRGERRFGIVRYGGLDGLASETFRYALALDRSPLRRSKRAWIVRLDTEIARNETSLSTASERLLAFLSQVEPQLASIGIEAQDWVEAGRLTANETATKVQPASAPAS